MLLEGIKDPVIIMLVHEPADLAAQGLDPYMWEEVISTPAAALTDVVKERAKAVSEGGWGIDHKYMQRRIDQDLEATKGYEAGPIADIAKDFYRGVVTNITYAKIPSLTGDALYVVPHNMSRDRATGNVNVILSGNDISLPMITLKPNRIVPVSGGYLVPLKYWWRWRWHWVNLSAHTA